MGAALLGNAAGGGLLPNMTSSATNLTHMLETGNMAGLISNPMMANPMVAMGQPGLMGQPAHMMAQQVQTANRQLTRCARRLYVGNLPVGMGLDEKLLLEFLNVSLASLGITTPYPVIHAPLKEDIKYTFIEFRSVMDCIQSISLLQGLSLGTNEMKISKPKDYCIPPAHLVDYVVPLDAELMGIVNRLGLSAPTTVAPDFNTPLAAALTDLSGAGGVPAIPTTVLTPAVTPGGAVVVPPLVPPPVPTGAAAAAAAAFGGAAAAPPAAPPAVAAGEMRTKVVVCLNMVTVNDLKDDEDYEDIVLDIEEECGKSGKLVKVQIARPVTGQETAKELERAGVGKIFLEYSEIAGAEKAKAMLHGRVFSGKAVSAKFYNEDAFRNGDLSG